MGKPKRQRGQATEQREQDIVTFTVPQQQQYEFIRPIVLFGESAAARAHATNTLVRTVSRHAHQFLEQGMGSLFAAPPSPLLDGYQPPCVALEYCIALMRATGNSAG